MEALMGEPDEECHTPKSSAEAVSKVLSQNSATSIKFLKNVGLEYSTSKKRTNQQLFDQQLLQEQLDAERQGSAALQEELESMKKQAQESQELLAKQQAEMEAVKKKQEETDAILQHLINLAQVNPSV